MFNFSKMLDLFTIFSKGGIVLWCFQSTSQIFTPSINALIKTVILQERTSSNSFDHEGFSFKSLTMEDMKSVLEKMKDHLITKNVAAIAIKLCESVATKLEGKVLGTFESIASTVKNTLTESLVQILSPKRRVDILRDCMEAQKQGRPYVMAFCGVNGVGKSTNLAKICFWLIENNVRVLIAACDTLRAGAVEQLRTHMKHLNALHPPERHNGQQMVQLYEKGYGKNAGDIAMEAIRYSKDIKIDVVLIDTAGWLQDNEPLMRALSKLIKVNEPDLVLFVGEALVGNEAVDQLVKFNQALADFSSSSNPHIIDGMVLTKLDTICLYIIRTTAYTVQYNAKTNMNSSATSSVSSSSGNDELPQVDIPMILSITPEATSSTFTPDVPPTPSPQLPSSRSPSPVYPTTFTPIACSTPIPDVPTTPTPTLASGAPDVVYIPPAFSSPIPVATSTSDESIYESIYEMTTVALDSQQEHDLNAETIILDLTNAEVITVSDDDNDNAIIHITDNVDDDSDDLSELSSKVEAICSSCAGNSYLNTGDYDSDVVMDPAYSYDSDDYDNDALRQQRILKRREFCNEVVVEESSDEDDFMQSLINNVQRLEQGAQELADIVEQNHAQEHDNSHSDRVPTDNDAAPEIQDGESDANNEMHGNADAMDDTDDDDSWFWEHISL